MNFVSKITTKGWIIIAVVVLIIVLIIYFSTRKKTVTTTTTVTTPPNSTVGTSGNGFPLQKGSSGSNVGRYQKYLKSKGANLGTYGINKDGIDNIWGDLTEKESLRLTGYNSITEAYFKGLGI